MLTAGTRIGQYEVGASLGAGGMGEVYRALDTRLGRQVAIKVLPALLSQDPDRLARFDREARTLAALNHPNIAAIHGVEDAGGTKALVMEGSDVIFPRPTQQTAEGSLHATFLLNFFDEVRPQDSVGRKAQGLR